MNTTNDATPTKEFDGGIVYSNLFHDHRTTIDKPCAAVLNTPRDAAIARFNASGLPRFGSEAYQHTDVQTMFAPDYGLNLTRLAIPVNPYDVFRCDVPNLSTQLFFLINDQASTFQGATAAAPYQRLTESGVLVGSLNQYAKSHPDLVGKYYNSLTGDADGTTALNTALCQDGFLLYVPKGVRVEKPIQLISLLRSDVDLMVNTRLLIVLEEGAEAKLLVCNHAMDERNFLTNQVIEVIAAPNTHFDLYELEETNTDARRVSSCYVRQERSSNVLINGLTLHTGQTRNNYHIDLVGEGAETSLCGMAIADKQQRVDTHAVVDHHAATCTSNQLFKYVLDEQAEGAFAGRVLVRQDAQKTAAFQSNKNMCISPEAKMHTKPQLEIYADDVKCSHGATVGQLDEKALFYMQSRGLSEKEARLLLKFAFAADVIELVRLDGLKERLHHLIEKRFRGELSKCAGCSMKSV